LLRPSTEHSSCRSASLRKGLCFFSIRREQIDPQSE